MSFNSLRNIAIALFISLSFVACTADQDENRTADLTLEIDGMFGSSPLSTSSSIDFNGTAIQVDHARFYVSNVVLLHEDGTEIAITDTPLNLPAKDGDADILHEVTELVGYLRHDQNENKLPLGEVPSGSYTGLRFDLGLRGLTNNVDPTALPAGHPLEKHADANNHWSWNSGYIFLRFEGYQDLNGDGLVENTEEAKWWLHLGTANMLRNIQINDAFTLQGDQESMLQLLFDYKKLLEAYGNNLPKSHTMNNMPQALTGANALQSVVEFQGVHQN